MQSKSMECKCSICMSCWEASTGSRSVRGMVTATGSTAKRTSSCRIKQCMPSWITFRTSPAILRLAPVNEAVNSKDLYTSLPSVSVQSGPSSSAKCHFSAS